MTLKHKKTRKRFAWLFIHLMILQCLFPVSSYALTGGPSQPEVESFTPIGVSDMVDASTGDFSYNIPLMEIGGYPLNLGYAAGIGTDQEASIVGLGWNLFPGMIKRNMRVLPDDFDGDMVEKEFYMKPNVAWGGTLGLKAELFGTDLAKLVLQPTLGISHSNYHGLNLEYSLSPSLQAGHKSAGYLSAGMGLSASAQQGIGVSPQISYSHSINDNIQESVELGLSVGASINSRQGLKALTLGPTLGIASYEKVTVKDKEIFTKKKHNNLLSPSAAYSFANPTYTPSFQFPMLSKSLTYSVSIGGEVSGSHVAGSRSGYYTKQQLLLEGMTVPAFGTLYAHNGQNADGLMDFNREKDGTFTIDVPNLPISVSGQDIYSVSGQGVGGSYQLKRSDVGLMYDKSVSSISVGSSIGGEVGMGAVAHFGVDTHFNFTRSSSGKWSDAHSTLDYLKYRAPQDNEPFYEAAYFKRAGELVSDEDTELFFNRVGQYEAVRVKLNPLPSSGMEVKADPMLVRSGGSPVMPITPIMHRLTREKRTQSISYLTAEEAGKYGLQTQIENHPLHSIGSPSPISRTSYPEHHISEITALRPDGMRYVYGIPVYNKEQKEVTFSIDAANADCTTGHTSYSHGSDNARKNGNGLDEFYSATTTPEYAHSYLLTAILSEDYVDVTGDGPSVDDYGNYTKFNYHKLPYDYQWRVPFEDANHNPGFQSDPLDDKADYLYGEKEVWLIHSIESKNQIAEFHYSDRRDSYGVDSEAGGMTNNSNMKLKKLDRINLYTIAGRMSSSPVPIKTVHFEYDYSLCPQVPNNDGRAEYDNDGNNINANRGKLTLKKLYFTHGQSHKGRLSPYLFEYNGSNPAYHLKAYNRWGTFQPPLPFCATANISANTCIPSAGNCGNTNAPLTTADFPYVPQDDRERQDSCAAAWNMTDIYTPSGAHIQVTYEADDYAYVQDKPAMQMFPIAGISNGPFLPSSGGTTEELYDPVTKSPNLFVFFELQEELDLSQAAAKKAVQANYLKDIYPFGFLYFKALVDLDNQQHHEYVPGYNRIEDWGVWKPQGQTNWTHGYIKLRPACSEDRDPIGLSTVCFDPGSVQMHPVSKAAMQFTRLNLPKLAYGLPQPNWDEDDDDHEGILTSLVGSVFTQLRQFANGFNNVLLNQGFAHKLVKGKSYLRLYAPYQKKIAGTHRVARITLDDNWANMTDGVHQSSRYGQVYEYTGRKKIDGDYREVSTGVAAYEPILGGEENPFRQPIPYKEALLLAPDNNHYQEEPLGESFFPAPTIVYSEVRVRNLPYTNVSKTATGYVQHKFYTAKDFPTKVNTTGLDPKPKKTKPLLKILKVKNEEYMTASQGYAIELNDMHGKARSQFVYDEFGTQVSGVKYRYQTRGAGKLDNEAEVILPDGSIEKRRIGVDFQMVADTRESNYNTKSGGVNLNNDNFLVGIFPCLTVVPLPAYTSEKTRFRSIVTTKVIHRYGILEKTIAFDQGSSIETQNLAFDSETGEPLLTRTYNEFEAPVFSLTLPAHWAYEGMQAAYQNIQARFTISSFNGQKAKVPYAGYFTPGDEVVIGDSKKAWVLWVDEPNEEIFLIDEDGKAVQSGGSIKIIRSGHRNKQATPIGSLVSLQEPIDPGADTLQMAENKQILQAGAVEFSEQWQTFCADQEKNCTCTDLHVLQNSFANFLESAYTSNGLFTTFQGPVNANYTQVLKSQVDAYLAAQPLCAASQAHQYWSNYNTATKQLDIYLGPDADCNCKTTLYFPAGFDPAKILYGANQNTFNQITFSPDLTTCEGKTFIAKFVLRKYGGGTQDVYVPGTSECFDFFDCDWSYLPSPATTCLPEVNEVVNPYRLNIRGVWRPEKNWAYWANRRQTAASASTNTNIEKDGGFDQFFSFWTLPAGSSDLWGKDKTGWVWATEATKFHPNGIEVENRDTLDRYSAELLGFGHQMISAVAANASYNEIAFDGFEDYHYEQQLPGHANCPLPRHFGFDVMPTAAQAHSGKYSLYLSSGNRINTEYPTGNCMEGSTAFMAEYKVQPCDCLNRFSPTNGRYVFSAWVREDRPPDHFDYQAAEVMIQAGGASYQLKASGEIIEGWQRIYGEFEIPTNAANVTIQLRAPSDVSCYFDDVRIHPYDASFKSYVYDDVNLRFTYELDENNYFTRYEYDKAGSLERVKKETERGVMTLQESYYSPPKNAWLK